MPRVSKIPPREYKLHIFRTEFINNTVNAALAPVIPSNPNKLICFELNTAKTDDEIINGSNYKFNIPKETLINDSDISKIAKNNRKNGTNKIPRRQNAWIIYRRNKSANPEFKGLKSADISKEVAKTWNKEAKEIVELFEALARKAVRKHIEKYGEHNVVYKGLIN